MCRVQDDYAKNKHGLFCRNCINNKTSHESITLSWNTLYSISVHHSCCHCMFTALNAYHSKRISLFDFKRYVCAYSFSLFLSYHLFVWQTRNKNRREKQKNKNTVRVCVCTTHNVNTYTDEKSRCRKRKYEGKKLSRFE